VLWRTGDLFNKGMLTMTLGATHNRPVNTAYTPPTPSANESQGVEQAGARSVNLGEGQRTAEGLPPSKSRIDRFTAAVSGKFKSLTDRLSAFLRPSQPRIVRPAQMKPQLAGQLMLLDKELKGIPIRTGSTAEKLEKLLKPPAGSMLGKALTAHAADRKDMANLNFVRGLGEGMTLVELREKYIFEEPYMSVGEHVAVSSDGSDSALNLDAALLNRLMKSLDAAIESGMGDVVVKATFDAGTTAFRVMPHPPRCSESCVPASVGSSRRG
jgi:hypothetical protein